MGSLSKSLVTSQPGKAIWTIGAVVVTVVMLPFWLLYYSQRPLRQHPGWTYHQAVMNQLFEAYLYHSAAVQVHTLLRLDSGAEGERFVIITPSSKDIYRGILQRDPAIQPVTTGGTWYPSLYKPRSTDNQTIVLHFHGGGYTIAEGRPADAAFAAKLLEESLDAKALFLSYRLASNPTCYFPAALQDAVTAYQYLLDHGISADRLVVSGDSAGGNLAIALLRYITDSNGLLPNPSAALLFSPWVNIASASDTLQTRRNKNYKTDYLPASWGVWGAQCYVPDSLDATNPYITPLAHPFSSRTPIWIHCGGLELFCDDIVTFAEELRNVSGNKVEVYVEPLANHDIFCVGNLTGFATEAARGVKAARRFVLENQSNRTE